MRHTLLRPLGLCTLLLPLAEAASAAPQIGEAQLNDLRSALQGTLQESHVPGMAIAVVHGDEVIFAEGFGFADLEGQRRASKETLFAIGSSTKAFTSAAVGMLVDEGKMAWDGPVTNYLPGFTLAIDSDDEDAVVTMRDLMSHRTGFTRMGVLWASGTADRATIIKTAGQAEAWAPFRKEFFYNNVMYLVAGEALGAASESSWDAFVTERLLKPLKMTSSNVRVTEAQKSEHLALGYRWNTESEAFERDPMRHLDNIAAAGAINSNVVDMAQWVRFQLAEGELAGQRLLSREALQETWTPAIEVAPGQSYGLGWFLGDWHDKKVVQHGGNIDGFSAMVALLPEEDLGFVLLMNTGSSSLQGACQELVFSTLLGNEKAELAPKEGIAVEASSADAEADYVGTYIANYAHFKDAEFKVLKKGEGLAIDIPGQMVFDLVEPDAEGKYAFKIAPKQIQLSFARRADGEVAAVVLYQNGLAFEAPREGVAIDPDGTEEDFSKYLGTYRHSELPAPIAVLFKNGRLVCDIPGQMAFDLRLPGEDDIWHFRATDELGLQFVMTDEGRAGSLVFHERGTETNCELIEAGTATLPTVDELAALRHFDASTKAMTEWGSMHFEGKSRMVHSGVSGTVSTTTMGMGSYHTAIRFGDFGWQSSAIHEGTGWSASAFDPQETLEGKYLAHAQLAHPTVFFGDWRAAFDDVKVTRTTEIDGAKCAVVQLKKGELSPWLAYVHLETGDVIQLDTFNEVPGIGSLPQEVRLEDYRDVEGIRMPFRIVTESAMAGRLVIQYERITPRAKVDPALFAAPAKEK